MRIIHVNFALGFRGGERQTLNLIAGLSRLGIQQTLVCRTGAALKQRCAHLPIDVVEVRHPLLGHARVPAGDLIHVHEARGAYWAWIEHLLRGTPYIITRRVPNPISNNRLTRIVYRGASALCGVSRDVARRLAQQTGRTVRPILSCSTLHEPDPREVADIRAMLGGGPVIGHVGALHDRHKGQSILLEAFHQLVRDLPDARLLLVGSGPDRDWFMRLANDDPRIHFAGFQQNVGPWLAAMDVLAFPSREEGLGSSVLDAMALGVPVVASAVGGLPELIGDDQRGLLLERLDAPTLAAALRKMLTDDRLRARLLNEARNFAARHSVAAMTQQYHALYQAVLDDGVNRQRGDRHAKSAVAEHRP